MGRILTEAAKYVQESIESLVGDASSHKRFGQLKEILSQPGIINPESGDFKPAREALRDVRILEFAFDQLLPSMPSEAIRSITKRAMQDSLLPEDDREKSTGRDAQCELYTAAICQKGSMDPDFAEPDIRCAIDGQSFGIAVKRIKNERQFEKRFRQALRQINNSVGSGYVVMDVSVAFNPDNKPIDQSVSDQGLAYAHSCARRAFVDRYYTRIKEWIAGRDICGFVLLDHHIRQHPIDGWGLDSFTFFVPLSPDNQRCMEFSKFEKLFRRGLATPPG